MAFNVLSLYRYYIVSHHLSPQPAVFDYAYTNADTNQTIKKLVFISW